MQYPVIANQNHSHALLANPMNIPQNLDAGARFAMLIAKRLANSVNRVSSPQNTPS